MHKLARVELGRFVGIVMGYNNLNFFPNKIGLRHDEKCRFCKQGHETVTHLMITCPRSVTVQRNILHNKMLMADLTWPVCDLLDFSYVPGITEAMEGTWAHGDPAAEPDRLSDSPQG